MEHYMGIIFSKNAWNFYYFIEEILLYRGKRSNPAIFLFDAAIFLLWLDLNKWTGCIFASSFRICYSFWTYEDMAATGIDDLLAVTKITAAALSTTTICQQDGPTFKTKILSALPHKSNSTTV